MTLILSNSVPESIIPNIGDIIATYELPDVLPVGFKGKVKSIETSENNEINILCEDIPLTDVVKRLYAVTVGNSIDERQLNGNRASNKSYSRNRINFNPGPIYLTTPFDIYRPITNPLSIGNSVNITLTPKISANTTIIVDENIGLSVHTDAKCSYSLKENINLASELSWSKDLPFIGMPVYFDIGYGFRIYLEGGLMADLSGETVQQHEFSQDFTHDFSVEYYSSNPHNSHTSSRFNLDKTDYKLKELSGSLTAKLATYMELGLTWLSKEIISAGARAEVGLRLSAYSGINIDELPAKGQDPENYNILKESNAVSLGGYWGVYGVGNIFMLGGSIGGEYETGTPLYEDYYYPIFTSLTAERQDNSNVLITVKMDEPSEIPFTVGFCISDADGNVIEKYYHTSIFVKGCDFSSFGHSVSGLYDDKTYIVTPIVRQLGYDIWATPCANLKSNSTEKINTLGHKLISSSNKAILSGQINRQELSSGVVGFVRTTDSMPTPYVVAIYDVSSMTDDIFNFGMNVYSNTSYNYRAFYTSNGQDTIYGETKTFFIPKENLIPFTLDADEIVNTAAEVSGYIEGYLSGRDAVTYYFEYSDNPDLSDCKRTETKYYYYREDCPEKTRLIGLKPYTLYYYRMVAEYGSDILYGDVRQFRTLDNGLQYIEEVDLGLSVNWASCNLNATRPESEGGRFQWAEVIEGDKGTYYDNNGFHIATFCYSYKDDAAKYILGEEWSVPTPSQVTELFDKCETEGIYDFEISVRGILKGVKFIGPNGNCIYLPAGEYWTTQ